MLALSSIGPTHASVTSFGMSPWLSTPKAIGVFRTARERIGAISALSPPGILAAATMGLNAGGGKFSNASQLVSTSLPTRSGRSVTSTWQMAPPVSLPMTTASVSSSASRNSAIRCATPRGDVSASGRIGRVCEPSGQSGTITRPASSSSGATLRQSRPLTSSPWTNTIGGAAPGRCRGS